MIKLKSIFKLLPFLTLVFSTYSSLLHAQTSGSLDDTLFIQGNFEQGFISNGDTSGQNLAGDIKLTNVVMGNPFPQSIGWVNPAASTPELTSADNYLVSLGMQHIVDLRDVFAKYYHRTDNAQSPDDIYLAYDFLIYNDTTGQLDYHEDGGYVLPVEGFQPLTVFKETDGLLAQQNLMAAQFINPYYMVDVTDSIGQIRQVELGQMILDVPYFKGVSHIMRGNLEMEKAFSQRFLTGLQTINPPINDELEKLGWDTLNNQFYTDKGAWSEFLLASQTFLEVLKSPVLRAILKNFAPTRALNYDDYQSTALIADELIYDGYKDVAAIYKAMAQRARILREVSKRLVLKLKRSEASVLIEKYIQQLAIEEAFITEFFFKDGLPANHEASYPGLASNIVELRSYITQAAQLRLAALNPELNALGFDDNVTYIRAADSHGQLSTYDWFGRESLSTITGAAAGRLDISLKADTQAQDFRKNFTHKAVNYMQEFETIDNNHDNELKAITGSTTSGEPNLDSPETGGGLLQQQLRNVQLAENNIASIKVSMGNIEAWISIEKQLQFDLGKVSDKRVNMINKTGQQIGDLQVEISNIQGDMAFASGIAAGISAAATAGADKFWGGGGIAAAAHTANAILQRDMQRKIGEKQRAITKHQTEKEASFEYFNREQSGLQSAADIQRQFLQMRVLHIDLLNAQISLAQEVDKLAQYYTKIEDLANQKRLANVRLAQRSFADPTYRIEVTNAALEAENKFGELQSWFYLWFKSLDYKWPILPTYQNTAMEVLKQKILRARTANELDGLRSSMFGVDDDQSTNTNDTGLFYASYSLLRDNYGITGSKTVSDGSILSTQQQLVAELQNALADVNNHVMVGSDIYFSIPFSTVRFDLSNDSNEVIQTEVLSEVEGQPVLTVQQANPAPLFGNGLWDSKIESVQVSIAGNFIYTNDPVQMPARLQYGGGTYLITKDYSCVTSGTTTKAINYRIYPPANYNFSTAVGGISWSLEGTHLEDQMTALITRDAPSNIPNEIYKSNKFRELPVAASDWRLLLPVEGINIANIQDIKINIIFKGRTAISRPSGFDPDNEICGVI